MHMRSRECFSHLFELCKDAKSTAQLHACLLTKGLVGDPFFATKLTSAYAKRGSIDTARQLFDETSQRNVFLWNAILRSYCREKQCDETLQLFHRMNSTAHMCPDNFTISIILAACAGSSALEIGKSVHGFVKKISRMDSDVFVGAALIELYSKSGEMYDARMVFDEIPRRDVFLWTSMVTGYQQNGKPEEALSFFSRMVGVERIDPSLVTLVSVVSACAQSENLGNGRCCHGYMIRRGFDNELSLVNSLLNLYAKLGSVEIAKNLFDKMPERDVISWSSMVACYYQNGKAVEALNLFNQMIEKGLEPNSVTVVSALQACSVACDLDEGRSIHKFAAHKGFELDVAVSTALIDMYMKCLCFGDALNLFSRMPNKDVISWAALMSGYALNGFTHKSLGVFHRMLLDGMHPDAVMMVKILAACSQLGVLKQALCLHGYLISSGLDDKVFVGAALIDLYSKCGSLDEAIMVFERMGKKDVVVWSSMIAGYGIHGHGIEALRSFDSMIQQSLKPNHVTFISILSACSHSGLVKEGIDIFDHMINSHGLVPISEHCSIMVDMLSRTGKFVEALEVIQRMQVQTSPDVWGALLGGCRIHHNVEMGKVVASKLFRLDPDHAGYYVLMSNIYAVDGKWRNVEKIRTLMKQRGVRKVPGYSSIEVGNSVHTFLVCDRSHIESEEIYGLLSKLEVKLRAEDYVPDRSFVM